MSETPLRADPATGGVGATRYDSFISYSHAGDGSLAKSMQDGLQRLAKPWYGRRALRVFRDATGLAVSPNLWSAICEAMDGSRYFILMASPPSAASVWVGRELERWLKTQPADRILIVVTDGAIHWVEELGDFDWDRSDALHPALRGAFQHEPLYLDLRWARADTQLNLQHPRFRTAVAELAAPIHGRPLEDLESDDLREQRKVRRAARGGVSTLVLLLVVAIVSMVVAFQQRGQAQHAATLAQARSLSSDAINQLQTGRNGLAILLAVAGNGMASGPSTRAALVQSLEAEPGLFRDLATTSGFVGSASFSSDGALFAADDAGTVRLWDVSGRPLPHPAVPPTTNGIGAITFGDNNRLITAYASGAPEHTSLEVSDVQTGAHVQSIPLNASIWTASAGTARLAFVNAQGDAEIWDGQTGRLVQRLTGAEQHPESTQSLGLALAADGTTLAVAQIRQVATDVHEYAETVDLWGISTAQPGGHSCQANIGGPFTGSFRMPPNAPQIMNTLIGSDGQSVTTLITGGTRGILSRCDLRSGDAAVTTADVPTQGTAPVSGISNDGSVIATRDTLTGAVHLFDAAGNRETRPSVQEATFTPAEFSPVIFSPDGQLVATPDDAIGEIKLWRTHDDGDVLSQTLQISNHLGLQAVDPTATALLAKTPTGDRAVVNRATGRVVVQVPASVLNQSHCDFTIGDQLHFVGSGHYVATPIQSEQCTLSVALWDARTGIRRDISAPAGACAAGLESVGLSTNDRILVVGCSGSPTDPNNLGTAPQTVTRIDISSPTPRLLSADRVDILPQALEVSPDGRTVIVAEEDRAVGGFQVMTLVGGHLKTEPIDYANGNFVGPAAFAPGGRAFATSFSDGRIQLWRLEAQGLHWVQLAATGPQGIASLAFSPNSSDLAVGDVGGSVRLFDVPTATLLGTIAQQRHGIDSLGFEPDGKSVIAVSAASDDATLPQGSMVSVADSVLAWTHAACTIVNRDLSPVEWAQFVPTAAYRTQCPRA